MAEASVLISPDLTAFRAKLIAELEAQTRLLPPITPRVQATGTANNAARVAGLAAEERGIQRVAAGEQTLSVARSGSARVSRSILASEQALAAVRKVDVGASTGVAAAQLKATAAKAAAAQATRTLTLVERIGTAEEIKYTQSIVAKTAALRTDTVEELRNAKATQASGASRAFAARGATTQALSFAGLRGAVLAARPAFIGGVVAAVALAKAIQTAASLESELAVFRVTAGATAEEMERVAANAKALGADLTLPAVTAGDAAQAMTELAKAGLSVNDSIAGARGVLQLATAAQITNAEATELAANALNAYGLAGDQAVHVADVLANAANAAQGSIVDFGQALAQSSAVARQVGLSLEDTTAILTLFARNGLRGSDAGTALRTSLVRLIAPTDKARGIIDDLGLRIRDLNGNVRADVFAQFGKATADLSPAVRDAAAAMIFGQDALRAVAIGAREGAQGLRDAQSQIAQTGTAAEVAGARMEGLTGAARGLGSQLETAGTTIGSALLPPLTGLTKGLSFIVGGFNDAATAAVNFGAHLGDLAEEAADRTPIFGRLAQAFEFLNRVSINPTLIPSISVDDSSPETIQEIIAALPQLGQSAEKQREILSKMFVPAIAQAEAFKASLAPGTSTKDIDALIKRLRAQFDLVQQGIPFDPDGEIVTPLQASLILADRLMAEFTKKGWPTTGIKRTIADLNNQIHTIDFAGPARESGVMINTIQAQFNNLDWSRPARESGGFADFVQADLGRVQDLLREAQANAKHLDPTDPLAPAARKSIQGIVEELKRLGPAGAAALKEAGAILQQAFKVNVTDGLLAAASLGVAQAARAGADAQVAALRDLEAVQQRAVARAQSRLTAAGGLDAAKGGKKLAVERVGELEAAVAAAASTAERIEGIQDQVVSDAKADQAETERKADEAQDARTKADQAFLESLQPRRDRIDRQTQRAAGTEGLQDNVNAARALKQRLLREIEIIRASNIDAKAKAEEIRRRADELIAVRQTITKARDDLREAREKIAEDRAAERTSLLEARLGLAEARGDKNAEVRAIDVLIADVNRRIGRTKKATAAYVQLQTEKQNLINKRNEVLEQDKELGGATGTTASDLLKQFVDIFQKSGGNLINADQPFAGPSGFSLPLDALLKFRPSAATAPVAGRAGRQLELRDGPLIQALDRLRIAYEQSSGNTSTAGVRSPFGSGVPAVQGLRDRQFWQSDDVRKVIDA